MNSLRPWRFVVAQLTCLALVMASAVPVLAGSQEERSYKMALKSMQTARKRLSEPDKLNQRDRESTARILKRVEKYLDQIPPGTSLDTQVLREELSGMREKLNQLASAVDRIEEIKKYLSRKGLEIGKLIPRTYSRASFRGKGGKWYAKQIDKFNPSEVQDKMKQALSVDPALSRHHAMTKLLDFFQKEYPEFVDSYLAKTMDDCIEEAFDRKNSNQIEATELFEGVLAVTTAALKLVSDHQGLERQRGEAEKFLGKARKEIDKKYITSTFHREHQGKFVFAPHRIQVGQEDPGKVKTSFQSGQTIHAVLYLGSALNDITGRNNKLQLFRGDRRLMSHPVYFSKKELSSGYAEIDLVPQAEHYIRYELALAVIDALSKLSPRQHVIRVELASTSGSFLDKVAEGAFELDASEGAQNYPALKLALRRELLRRTFPPAAQWENKALAKKLAILVQREKRIKGKLKRLYFVQKGWNRVNHHDTQRFYRRDGSYYEETRITGSHLELRGIVVQALDNGECRYDSILFGKENKGSHLHVQAVSADGKHMDCANAFKVDPRS